MKVFISWSKPTSRTLGNILRDWLPEVIQEVVPWMSSEDIDKGQRWASEVGAKLSELDQGILCVTAENIKEPWLNFEAGALAKSLDDARVRPILLGLQPSDVTGPLTQFQATMATDREDMHKLIASLNALCERPLDAARLERAFSRTWDDYLEGVQRIRVRSGSPQAGPQRQVPDMVAEILERVREMQRGPHSAGSLMYEPLPTSNTKPGDLGISRRERRLSQGLGGMLLPELQSLAASLGVSGTARMRKGQLIEAIEEAQGADRASNRSSENS